MLSYQHKYHAGNHADVLKHICMLAVMQTLSAKPKDFFVLDTHAGDGIYPIGSLTSADEVVASAFLDAKMQSEIGQLYAGLINEFMRQSTYPGSPVLIEKFIKIHTNQKVSFHVNELSTSSVQLLRQNLPRSVHVHQSDAFKILTQLLPPMPRRGMVLIDPPYEDMHEYAAVVTSIERACRVWAQGIYLVWYPLLSETRWQAKNNQFVANPKAGLSQMMVNQLLDTTQLPLLKVEFSVEKSSSTSGMFGSGVCIINPPWKLDQIISEGLEDLRLGIGKQCHTSIDWLRVAS